MNNLFKKAVGSLIVISFLFLVYTSNAQGILRGKIIDGETGEELIGATMMLKGTSQGAVSDLDGNYSVIKIEPGVYTVACSYISYEPQEFDNVEIKDGEVTIINVKLLTASVGLQEVVVTAKAENRTEAALLTVQKKSANVIDGISAQAMSRSGDSEAAGALRRVTGVNVEGGKYVYIRGLSDRYSKTTLNSVDLPGLDPERNTVQMDLFPTSLIDNLIVYKTFTPDLPADFTGGLINIVTKDFPEEYTLSFGLRLGYNTNASFNNNFLTYQGSSTDFLGFGNSTRNIPSDAQGQIPNYNGSSSINQSLTSITESFNKIMAPEESPSLMNGSFRFSVGNQLSVGKRGNQLGYVVGLSYKYNENLYTNGQKGLYKLNGTNDTSLNLLHKYNDNQGAKEALWGAIGNLTYKFKSTNKIGLNLIINHSGVSTARYLEGQKPSDDPNLILQTRVLQWVQRQLASGQLKGEHYFEDLSKMKLEWVGAVTSSYQDEPDTRFFTNSYYPNLEAPYNYTIEPSIYTVPARYYRYMNELNYFGRVDLTFDIGSHIHAPKLKVGGLASYKDRDFTEERVDYNWQFSATSVYNGNVPDFLADENIGTNYFAYNTNRTMGLYVQKPEIDNLRNSYTANQTIGSAYAMIDATLKEKLRIIAGLRYEYTEINSASYDPKVNPGYLQNNNFLPAIGLTWMMKESMNLRLNYGRSVARPSFRELAPYASENFAGGETWIGNDSLKMTIIDNIDLRWEDYFGSGEIISFGVFYKIFHDPIEVVDNPKAQNPELTWQNVDVATVYGAEIDFRTRLDFWNPIRNLLVGLNFSYIYSEVSKDTAEYPFGESTRPMFGQSPYIINAYLVYENRDMGLNVNLVYNVSGPKMVINVKGITPDIYAQPLNSLNLTANKTIGEKWLIEFRAKNLLNATYTESYQDFDNIYRQFQLGTTFELGFKYSIN